MKLDLNARVQANVKNGGMPAAKAAYETWGKHDGQAVRVKILREYPDTEELCPRCGGELKIVVGRTEAGEELFRLECLACSWASEALPEPKER